MSSLVVVGAQWGDEGKAKVVDLLAQQADLVIRSQGGCNAGHTVQHNGHVFKFHHLPSGLLYEDKTCVIASGVVISPMVLQDEIHSLKAKGYSLKGLKISQRAHVSLPYHVAQDHYQESLRHKGKLGTTGRGIGPTYMDKVGRLGIRVIDLFEDEAVLKQRLSDVLLFKQAMFDQLRAEDQPQLDSLLSICAQYREILAPYVCDSVSLLNQALNEDLHLLFEGAQGTLLDVDYGTYPFVTSSNATAGGACTGTGIGPSKIDQSLGVMKAYLTRVGEGPFPTELTNEQGQWLATQGQEIGTTTGRSRRCGWFDAVLARYSVQVNGLDSMALTKLDVLSGLESIQVCVAYRHRSTGETVKQFPASLSQLSQLEPVYERFDGWSESISDVKEFKELPPACQHYVHSLEALCGCPVSLLSIGADRSQTLTLRPLFLSSKERTAV